MPLHFFKFEGKIGGFKFWKYFKRTKQGPLGPQTARKSVSTLQGLNPNPAALQNPWRCLDGAPPAFHSYCDAPAHTHTHTLTQRQQPKKLMPPSLPAFEFLKLCLDAIEQPRWSSESGRSEKGKLGSNRWSFSLLPCRSASSRNGESCADRISILSRGVEQTLPITLE